MTRTDISHTNFSAKVEPFMQKIVRKLFLEIESVKTYVRVLVKCPNSRDTSDILFFLHQFQQSCDIIGLFGNNVSKSLGWLHHFDTLGKSRILGQGYSQAGTFWCVMLRHEYTAPTNLLWCKQCYVTNTGPQLTSFAAKTVTDPLCCKNRYLTNRPPLMQKNVTWRTRGPDRPFICLDIMGRTTIHAWWHQDLQGYTKRFGFVRAPKLRYSNKRFPKWPQYQNKIFFVVSGCTKRQILRIHPSKNLGSEVCEFVIIDIFVARFWIPFCPLEVLRNGQWIHYFAWWKTMMCK